MALFLNKRCSPFCIIYRHFRSNSVNLMPRGVGKSERRRERSLGLEYEIEELDPRPIGLAVPVVYRTEEPKSSSCKPSHKDTRPIDSVDPVILKYVELLNKGSVPQEKIHLTNFGTIRFDNDNVPEVHGQFDIGKGPDNAALADEILMNSSVYYQNESVNIKKQAVEVAQSSGASAVHYEAENQKPKSFADKPRSYGDKSVRSMSESETAFEELFGSEEDIDVFSVDDTSHGSLISSTKESSPNKPTHGVGFIDEQFFNEAVVESDVGIRRNIAHHYNDPNSINADFTKSFPTQDVGSTNADFTKSFHTQDVGSTNDLNFIDQTYFKSSLDTLEENRTPAVEFSEIKQELKNAVDNLSITKSDISKADNENWIQQGYNKAQSQQVSNIALEYLGIDPSTESLPIAQSAIQHTKEKEQTPDRPIPESDPAPKSAYDYVLKKRKEAHDSKFGFGAEDENPKSRSYQKVLSLVRERTIDKYTKHEILTLLKKSILYDKNDIVGLYKPYGVAMHEGTQGSYHILSRYLPKLAEHLKAEELHAVHRLDATTTGVLLLARTPAMADTLKAMFKKQEIKKIYWTITKGIPSPLQGLIDIPIAEGSIDGRHRMTLRPDVDGFRGPSDKCHRAVTGYRVMGKNVNSALVEITPQTGVKHQVRVHLGFGLSCPVLGDHKYSHLKKMAPQRLPGDLLERLKLKQSKVRNLPMCLHSRSVLIPEIADGRNVFINAKLPAFFNKTISALKLNTHKNQVRYDGSRCIDE